MISEPVFTSVGQALHVSWLMEILPVTQKVSTQILIDSIREQLGKVEARVNSTINLGGMSPLEFRGQCAMVRGSCEHHLTRAELDAVRLRFGWQLSQAKGVAGMADFLGPMLKLEHDLALRALLWSQYHRGSRKGLALRDIERETGVSIATLSRASKKMRAAVEGLEMRACRGLDGLFVRTGLVPPLAA